MVVVKSFLKIKLPFGLWQTTMENKILGVTEQSALPSAAHESSCGERASHGHSWGDYLRLTRGMVALVTRAAEYSPRHGPRQMPARAAAPGGQFSPLPSRTCGPRLTEQRRLQVCGEWGWGAKSVRIQNRSSFSVHKTNLLPGRKMVD